MNRARQRGAPAGDTATGYEEFYKVRFQLGEAVGRSVMYVRGGGINSAATPAFAHIGTYVETDAGIDIEIKTVRHNPDPNYRAMAGTDDATLLARGTPDGDLYRFTGGLKAFAGGVAFSSVMTPIEEERDPDRRRRREPGQHRQRPLFHPHPHPRRRRWRPDQA